MKWKIGNVTIANQLVLAPMAGICETTFRSIIKSMGCGLIETEMVSDKAIMYENTRTQEMLEMNEFERPISQQIFGCEVKSFKIEKFHRYSPSSNGLWLYKKVGKGFFSVSLGASNKAGLISHIITLGFTSLFFISYN